MKRSPLTAVFKVFLGDNGLLAVYYVDIFDELQFVATCDLDCVLELVQEVARIFGFEGFEVGFFVEPSAAQGMARDLRAGRPRLE